MRVQGPLIGKLTAFLLPLALIGPVSALASEEVMVRYERGADRSELRDAAGVLRSDSMLLSRTEVVVPIPGSDRSTAVQRLRQLDGVEQVEPVRNLRLDVDPPDDPFFRAQWALENTGQAITGIPAGTPGASIAALTGWNVASQSPGVLTAVIDSGVRIDHPDLTGQIRVNPGEIAGNGIDDDSNGLVDDVKGWNFVTDSVPEDHGTHVAGIIGATAGNGIGISGVSQNANLLPLTACVGGGCPSDAVVDAAEYARQRGAKVVNLSLGGELPRPLLRDVMESADDVLFVASAGNEGENPTLAFGNTDLIPHYPCMSDQAVGLPFSPGYEPPLENVICVAGSDRDDRKTPKSSYGASGVDLAAPGASILSTVASGNYAYKSGTSMAAPQVAGAASLLRQAEPGLTAAQVKQRILASVEPAPEFSALYPTVTGGRLDLTRLFDATLTPPELIGPADGARLTEVPVLRWSTPEKRLLYTVEVNGLPEYVQPGLAQYRPIGKFPPGRHTWRIRVTEAGNDEVYLSEERSFVLEPKPGAPTLKVLKVRPAGDRKGGVRARLRLSAAGKVRVLVRPAKGARVLARAAASRRKGGTFTLLARPTRAGKSALRGRKRLRVRLGFTYRPRSGPVRKASRRAWMSAPKRTGNGR